MRSFIKQLLEKETDMLSLGLSFIFFIVCILHVILIVLGQNIEQMWMVFGTLAIMLLLLKAPKNILTIFVIIVFGTFVADEEFLLEVAAISKGEQLSIIRGSRDFEVLTVTPEKEVELALTKKLKDLLSRNETPENIIQALEVSRMELAIKEDLSGFEAVDKDVIKTFASQEHIEESVFFNIMQNKGYSVDNIADTFEKLGAAEYLSNNPDNVDEAQLTAQGKALAKALGVTGV